MSNSQLALQFFLQIALILTCCRIVGVLALRLGQPQVVAEMLTGMLLGPSLFGWLAPQWQQWFFPWDPSQATRDTQSYLYPVSQLGLALYMFVVGIEFRVDILRAHLRSSVAVSLAGMVAPLALGAGLAWLLHSRTALFPPGTSLSAAMLFLGASMCITAFPMLARIVQHKGLDGTTLGTVALGAGAINDAAAWCLLAVVLASLDDNVTHALLNIAGGLGFVAVTLGVLRPLLARLERHVVDTGALTETGTVMGILLLAVGAWFTDLIGLHAVLGAFVMGAAIPRGLVARELKARLQPLAVTLLLPLFFAYSGLNTRITLLNSGHLWLLCLAVLIVAIVGKGLACWLAARWTGISNREALGIGVLMNARGLMELIIINVGLERGVISESLFAMLAIMAVLTTLMTSPVFDRLVRKRTSG